MDNLVLQTTKLRKYYRKVKAVEEESREVRRGWRSGGLSCPLV